MSLLPLPGSQRPLAAACTSPQSMDHPRCTLCRKCLVCDPHPAHSPGRRRPARAALAVLALSALPVLAACQQDAPGFPGCPPGQAPTAFAPGTGTACAPGSSVPASFSKGNAS